jgi:hypothetical protein
MSKAQRNAQLNAAIEQFLLNGGQIQTVPAKKVKVRVTCSGRMKSANNGGGLAPVFKISSLYFQGDNSEEVSNA